jgi:hypothetical protein
VQGEGGFHTDPGLFEALEKLREQYGILVIADEVQAGFARTGKMFGIEHQPIKPDLISVAKSLGGGFAFGRDRPRGRDGRDRAGRAGRHLWRRPHRGGGRAGGAGCDRG